MTEESSAHRSGYSFLPERPYLSPGSLRKVPLSAGQESTTRDEEILQTLKLVEAEVVLRRAGSLEKEQDWDDMLSLGEQQSLAFARLLMTSPRFAMLDRPGTALSVTQVRSLLKLLADRSITYVTLGDGDDQPADYSCLLEFDESGTSRWASSSAQGIASRKVSEGL